MGTYMMHMQMSRIRITIWLVLLTVSFHSLCSDGLLDVLYVKGKIEQATIADKCQVTVIGLFKPVIFIYAPVYVRLMLRTDEKSMDPMMIGHSRRAHARERSS